MAPKNIVIFQGSLRELNSKGTHYEVADTRSVTAEAPSEEGLEELLQKKCLARQYDGLIRMQYLTRTAIDSVIGPRLGVQGKIVWGDTYYLGRGVPVKLTK